MKEEIINFIRFFVVDHRTETTLGVIFGLIINSLIIIGV